MKPSLERAAPPTNAAPMTPTPSLAKRIIGFSFLKGCHLFRVGVARVYPNADVFIVAADSDQGRVADIFKRLDRSFDIELVLRGVGDQGLDDIPGNCYIDVFSGIGIGILVNYVHHELP